ncbi:MAG: response regulator transcription factor [Phycisphaerales bacterium]|nr:response regulator transcription factor [Phycisphaerales bacterium]
MSKGHILVVDDEEDLLELVSYNLRREGYEVDCVTTGETALRAARSRQIDLILLDLMLPGADGLDVCRALRSDPQTRDVSIVMLTAKGDEADVVAGIELGADDYITKPFSPRVLLARIRAVLRRRSRSAAIDDNAAVHVHELSIDPVRHEVTLAGRRLDLTITEFRILSWLARHPGRVFTRPQIIDAVRGDDYPVTERSVDVQIVALRRKLEDHGDYIETIRGVGYRFKE